MAKAKRIIANTKSALIEAVLTQSFRFSNVTDALAKIAFLKGYFIATPHLLPESPEHIVLWIKGYALSEAEIEEGRIGNFAQVTWQKITKNKITLSAQKLDIPLERHPQRKKLHHPDWGHYLLRRCKKGHRYVALAEANNELQRMAKTYPQACVLVTNKLYVKVYKNKGENLSALEPMTLEIKTAPEGGFVISCEPNTYMPMQKADSTKEVQGSFSARVLKSPSA